VLEDTSIVSIWYRNHQLVRSSLCKRCGMFPLPSNTLDLSFMLGFQSCSAECQSSHRPKKTHLQAVRHPFGDQLVWTFSERRTQLCLLRLLCLGCRGWRFPCTKNSDCGSSRQQQTSSPLHACGTRIVKIRRPDAMKLSGLASQSQLIESTPLFDRLSIFLFPNLSKAAF